MKNKEHQAYVHSRLDAMQNSRKIKEAMESSIALSKRNFKETFGAQLCGKEGQ
jgi:hypothetical protein